MGVMACYRNGCENVMCTRLSDTYGYICHECFDELVAFAKMRYGTPLDIVVQEFMSSTRSPFARGDLEHIERQLEEEFASVYDK